jgi:hypothetical protein
MGRRQSGCVASCRKPETAGNKTPARSLLVGMDLLPPVPEPASRVSIAAALRRRQRLPRVGASALAVVAVAAAMAAPRVSLSGNAERSSGPVAIPAGWSRLPDAPIAPRSEYAAVWTGKQMIVWGGYSWDGSFPLISRTYGDGAAYDPATRTWTKLAAGPLAARTGSVAVWTGKDMLIFGGVSSSGAYSDGAAYDPASNTWRKLAPIPGSLGNLTASGSYAVWTGKLMVAWGFFGNGGSGAHGGGSLAAATYNPAANSWTTGTAAPSEAPVFGHAFWTGKQMIVWGFSPGSEHLEGFAYNPATRRWSVLPPSPLGLARRASMLAVWTGKYLVVGGGNSLVCGSHHPICLQKDAAAYDPATGTWKRLPDAPVGFEGDGQGPGGTVPGIWTGASVITIEDGVAGGRPLSLDLATMRWSLGPNAPVPGRQDAHELWTGSEVLVWGGGVWVRNYCCKTVIPGYSYRP